MKKIEYFLREQKPLSVLIVLAMIMCFASPYFLTGDNIINIFVQSSIYGIMACGMSFAIISGDFDLSIGSTMALTGVLAIRLEPVCGQALAILIVIMIGCLIGLLNGWLVAKIGLSSFIVTIGMSQIVKGVALRISDGKPVNSSNDFFNQFGNIEIVGIPVLILFLVIAVLITGYVLRYTRYGRNVYSVGGNKEVAHNSGINVLKVRIIVFMICSVCAGVAGVLNASRLNTAAATYGDNAALNVITGVVIGGTSLVGGVGGIGKSIIGVLLFTLITNALDLLGVFSYYQTVIRGVLLVAIIAVGAYSKYRHKA